MKIGIAGTGKMGAAMAGRLAGLGHDVTVWNRSADKARALGLKVADTPQALAAGCETVISMLTDAAAVEAVYQKLLAKDKLFIDMSTVRPEIPKKLEKKAKAAGAQFVECPVGGSVGPAKEGKLFGFAGGDAVAVARAKPILEQLCRRLEHVGPAGSGASMKLAINLPLLVYYQALSEALSLIKDLKLDPEKAMSIFADTSGAPGMLKIRAPIIAQALAGKETPVSVDVDTIRKDLREMAAEGRSLGRRMPLTEQALACYDEASKAGLGAKDCTQLPARWISSP
jgi:3-hydroxyisobutyrate dehydrogenase